MSNKYVEFLKRGANPYSGPTKLWCIASENNSNGSYPWLETHWVGKNDHESGLAIFTSKLDALIQCLYMNVMKTKGNNNWKVYEYSDLNRREMARNMKFNFGHNEFGFALVFGFMATPNKQLISNDQVLLVSHFYCHTDIDVVLELDHDAKLNFDDSLYTQIENNWENGNPNYYRETKDINELSDEYLNKIALKAFKSANQIPVSHINNLMENSQLTVGSCFLAEDWVFSSYENLVVE